MGVISASARIEAVEGFFGPLNILRPTEHVRKPRLRGVLVSRSKSALLPASVKVHA